MKQTDLLEMEAKTDYIERYAKLAITGVEVAIKHGHLDEDIKFVLESVVLDSIKRIQDECNDMSETITDMQESTVDDNLFEIIKRIVVK